MVIKWIRSFLSSSRKLVGTDHLGNRYYESIKSSGAIQRSIDASMKHEDYTSGQIPHEWEAWVRGKRTDPPLQQEIDKRIHFTASVQQKAKIKQIQDDENQSKAFEDGLIARERPSVDTPGQQAMSREVGVKTTPKHKPQPHASEGPSYEPGSWSPGTK